MPLLAQISFTCVVQPKFLYNKDNYLRKKLLNTLKQYLRASMRNCMLERYKNSL